MECQAWWRGSLQTHCTPGARVADILDLLLAKHSHAQNVIIHVGCSDIPRQMSDNLKQDFIRLLDFLNVFLSSAPLLPSREALIILAGALAFTPCFNLSAQHTVRFLLTILTCSGIVCPSSSVAASTQMAFGTRVLMDNLFYTVQNASSMWLPPATCRHIKHRGGHSIPYYCHPIQPYIDMLPLVAGCFQSPPMTVFLWNPL